MKLLKLIKESRQVGTIYHYTTGTALKRITECNCLRAGKIPYLDVIGSDFSSARRVSTSKQVRTPNISCTRNKNLHKEEWFLDLLLGMGDDSGDLVGSGDTYRIALNGNLLSTRYSIKPFNFFMGNYPEVFEGMEAEEQILTSVVKDLDKYVLSVDNVTSEIGRFARKNLHQLR